MTVQITFTFANQAEAAAFLAGKPVATPMPAPSPAPTARTEPSAPAASPSPAAAPAESAKTYDFDKDVVPALQGLAKKISNIDFAAVMKHLGAAKVSVLKEKTDKWPAIMAYCENQSPSNFAALA